jgi:hypothetical protein
MLKEEAAAQFEVNPNSCMEWPRKTMKDLSQDSWYTGLVFDLGNS